MNLDDIIVTPPRKDGVLTTSKPVNLWPLIEAALDVIGADETTRDAAKNAITCSDGCVVLGNYLNSEAKRVKKMDYRFKVPLIVYAAELAREDDRADSVYDPEEGAIYFETDEDQYSFHVYKDWTVDWESVADEIIKNYEWSGNENQTWALDLLLAYQEIDLDQFRREPDDV